MSLTDAHARWDKVYKEFDEWISEVVEETRGGVGLAPPDVDTHLDLGLAA